MIIALGSPSCISSRICGHACMDVDAGHLVDGISNEITELLTNCFSVSVPAAMGLYYLLARRAAAASTPESGLPFLAGTEALASEPN